MAYKPQVGDRVFDMMTTAADSTDVSLEKGVEFDKSTESIHTALMAAGFAPGLGNIADITDATLYALEGEFGEAAWSAAAAIPIIGQMVAGKRALKVAKESGEEMVTLYRGVDNWYPGRMVKEGKFIGGGGHVAASEKKSLWVTQQKGYAENIASGEHGVLLEFEVPISYVRKGFVKTALPSGKLKKVTSKGIKEGNEVGLFPEGLPKEFLKKVHSSPSKKKYDLFRKAFRTRK